MYTLGMGYPIDVTAARVTLELAAGQAEALDLKPGATPTWRAAG